MKAGERLVKRYHEAMEEWKKHAANLQDLEETINALDHTIIPQYKKIYSSMGGEQFRPDPLRFKCELSQDNLFP